MLRDIASISWFSQKLSTKKFVFVPSDGSFFIMILKVYGLDFSFDSLFLLNELRLVKKIIVFSYYAITSNSLGLTDTS